MFKRDWYFVWIWDSLRGRTQHVAVLTPNLSDAFDLAEHQFEAHGYEMPSPRGQWLGHPMCRGIPRASVRDISIKKEVELFLRGLNKPWGTWDFRSIATIKFTDDEINHQRYADHLAEIEKSMNRRHWIYEKFGIDF
jgi:hypothetical protein